MRTTVKIEGLADLDEALRSLPKSTSRSVLRSAGVIALKPVIEAAREYVPVDEGDLRDSLTVTTRLSRRQRRKEAKQDKEGKPTVQLYAGAAALPHAHLVEFGTSTMPAQPFLRPAWEREKLNVLKILGAQLGIKIDKAVKRLARKAARLAAKNGK
ncbi:MAG: HK97-gp10 family putative phage morphogenesis protein [Pseudomonadota bacterium]